MEKELDGKMEKHNFMDDGTKGPFWSRDFSLQNIPCKIELCPSNVYGKCIMPSAIIIGEDGKCETGEKYKKKRINKKTSEEDSQLKLWEEEG